MKANFKMNDRVLWVVAALLLVLCLRINAVRQVEGPMVCMDPQHAKWAEFESGCTTIRSWTVNLKLPWNGW